MVLWSKQFGTGLSSKDNPLNQLIGTVLLEERAGEETFSHETMNMKWTRDNQLQLVFVVRPTRCPLQPLPLPRGKMTERWAMGAWRGPAADTATDTYAAAVPAVPVAQCMYQKVLQLL